MTDISNKTLAQLLDALENAETELRKAKHVIRLIEEAKIQSYRELPGIEGVFDGTYMLTDDGQKFEVPSNYSAKSRLVYGDRLKKVEDNGETLYKQIEKKPRRKIEGILNKKEGKWYIIADAGSYRVSDAAVEFNHADLNDEAIALIPEADLNVPFAALDKVLTQKQFQPHSQPVVRQPQFHLAPEKPKERVNVISHAQPVRSPAPASTAKPAPKPKRRPAPVRSQERAPEMPKIQEKTQNDQQDPNTLSTLRDLGDDDLR